MYSRKRLPDWKLLSLPGERKKKMKKRSFTRRKKCFREQRTKKKYAKCVVCVYVACVKRLNTFKALIDLDTLYPCKQSLTLLQRLMSA